MASPEKTIRQIVARQKPLKGNDPNLEGAIRFILQQQGQKSIKNADLSVVSGDEHDTTQLIRRIHGSIVSEAKEPEQSDLDTTSSRITTSQDGLANLVAQGLNRYSFLKDADDRGMLLLIAALMLLNVSDGGDNINSTARRLITAGLSQMKKRSK